MGFRVKCGFFQLFFEKLNVRVNKGLGPVGNINICSTKSKHISTLGPRPIKEKFWSGTHFLVIIFGFFSIVTYYVKYQSMSVKLIFYRFWIFLLKVKSGPINT